MIPLILLLFGASCSVKHHYPTWPVPEKPKVVFFPCRAEPAEEEKKTDETDPVYCIFSSDLSLINTYVEELLMTIESYEREIHIINGTD